MILACVLIAFAGLILGGFIGRAAYALPRGVYREILTPSCPSCGKSLPLRYSIPLIGSFLLSFRCSRCGERLSISVLLSEILYAVISVLLYVVWQFSYPFFLYAVLAGVLLLLSLIDLDIREAPHPLLLIVLLLGTLSFVFSFFEFSLSGAVWWEHLVGAFVVSLPLFLLMIFTGGIGGGDVKLMFCLGLLLGYKMTLLAFFFGIVIAAIVSVVLRLACGKGGKYQVPLIPFLSIGTMVTLLWGERILSALF